MEPKPRNRLTEPTWWCVQCGAVKPDGHPGVPCASCGGTTVTARKPEPGPIPLTF